MAILVERDLFLAQTAFADVRVWTYDQLLDAHNHPPHQGKRLRQR